MEIDISQMVIEILTLHKEISVAVQQNLIEIAFIF